MISTVAGTGMPGHTGDGGPATAAKLREPVSLSFDAAGNIFVADYNNLVVRKIDPSGTITTAAGTGSSGYTGDGGPPAGATFNIPNGVAAYGNGCYFIADRSNNVIRVVDHTPVFVAGATDSLHVCEDYYAPLNTILSIIDSNVGQVETWKVSAAPLHGTLTGFPLRLVTAGVITTPAGLVYTPVAGYTGTDTLKVTVSDRIRESVIRVSVRVDSCGPITLSTADKTPSNELSVYPNPCTGFCNVELPATNTATTIIVQDITGRIVETKTVDDANTRKLIFDMGNTPRGNYILTITGDKSYKVKLMVW